MKRLLLFGALAVLAGFAVGAYRLLTPSYTKVGEVSFHKDAQVELKVVLTHSYLPLHYIGNSYAVACRSDNTRDFPGSHFDNIKKGWTRIPAYLGGGQGDDTELLLQHLVERAKASCLVTDKGTVAVLHATGVHFSFDGCRKFTSWRMEQNLPAELLVDSSPEFEQCMVQLQTEKQNGLERDSKVCIPLKFAGDNQPSFSEVSATKNGHASFNLASSAIKSGKTLHVETRDFGNNWTFAAIEDG